MAKQIAAQVGAWVKPIETVEMADTGDATAVLRRVYQQFALKAVEMYEKASGKDAKKIRTAAEYYEQAAIDIQRLIDQGTEAADESAVAGQQQPE
jgi:hypothetical protein